MEKLELKHLAAYLPYGINVKHIEYENLCGQEIVNFTKIERICNDWVTFTKGCDWWFDSENDCEFKLILHPLSDLTKPIVVEGYNDGKEFIPADIIFPKNEYKNEFERDIAIGALKLQNAINHSCTYYSIVEILLSWHFDVFNLIANNLAFDINEIK